MKILKFGGSSVANAERIKNAINIIKNDFNKDSKTCLIISAQAKVTDQLNTLCELISNNDLSWKELVKQIEQRHLDCANKLVNIKKIPVVCAEIISLCNELTDIAKGSYLVGEVSPRTKDLILSFGERLSAYLFSNALMNEFNDVNYVDARLIIKTDSNFGHAKVNFDISNKLIQEKINTKNGIHVIPGFIASSNTGQTTTLGRSGSDYTASIIGAALNAEVIEIWTDVNGIMTADPNLIPAAKTIEQLSYAEAMELSHFGAKVIFPTTMLPAMEKKIPLLVKNTFAPEHKGTEISNIVSKSNSIIKGITALDKICLFNIEGGGMIGVAGISAKIFTALSGNRISVILISQASSEHSICIGLNENEAALAQSVISTALSDELRSGAISSINFESNLAVIAVVGENMRRMSGVASKVMKPLSRNGINIKAIAQGSSELNISLVVRKSDLKKAMRSLHQSLFESENNVLHLYIAGYGNIGKRLLEMINEQKEELLNAGIEVALCGLINSSKMQMMHQSINEKPIFSDNADESNMNKFIENLIENNFENSVYVDVTASEVPVPYYPKLLNANVAIVAANKRANSNKMEFYKELKSNAGKRNTPFFYETNVCAGLPLINVLKNLRSSGDKVEKVEAILSGTLNYLLSEFNGSIPFSELIAIAKNEGLTEPDLRDDLSGMDVARKALILARECGWEFEPEQVEPQSVIPIDDKETDVLTFLERLKKCDNEFLKHYESANKKGMRLRYLAEISELAIKVGIVEVDPTHPFYNVSGTENCVSIKRRYYQKYPMLIKGPGAGIDVTASGVLGDILRIAESIRN